MMNKLQHIISKNNGVFTLADQGIVSGLNFTLSILLARYLGLEGFGIYATILLFIQFSSSIQNALIISPILSLKSKYSSSTTFNRTLFSIQLIFSLCAFIGCYLMAIAGEQLFHLKSLSSHSILVGAVAFGYSIFDYGRRVSFSNKKSHVAAGIDFLVAIVQFSIFLWLGIHEKISVSTVLVVQSCCYTFGGLAFVVFNQEKMHFNFCTKDLKVIWNYSKYLLWTTLLQWVSGNYYILIAGGIIGPTAVGIIRLIQNVFGVFNVLFLGLENLVLVKSSTLLHQQGKTAFKKYFRTSFLKIGSLTFTSLLFLYLFRSEITTVLYNDQLADQLTSFSLFTLLYVFVFVGTFIRFLVRTLEKNAMTFWSYLVCSGVSLIIAKPLIENFDEMGIVFGLIISQIITLSTYLILIKKDIAWILK